MPFSSAEGRCGAAIRSRSGGAVRSRRPCGLVANHLHHHLHRGMGVVVEASDARRRRASMKHEQRYGTSLER
jgi:hypothetical protein